MQTASKERKKTVIQIIDDLLSFIPSDKLKFAIKVSLAMALAYLIPFSQGWAQAQTAAITVMLIAVAGPVGESISKGLRRVAGTVIGAIIGMLLIGFFPQDREWYLLFLSIFVTFFLYLTRAYKGDMTVFMLTSV
ncbi:MAG: FUSC family protein, partial [Campylobacterota bacterium]|nr:FUSC family protein [Campylobacterota bacterium]